MRVLVLKRENLSPGFVDIAPFSVAFDRPQSLGDRPGIVELRRDDLSPGFVDVTPLSIAADSSEPPRRTTLPKGIAAQ